MMTILSQTTLRRGGLLQSVVVGAFLFLSPTLGYPSSSSSSLSPFQQGNDQPTSNKMSPLDVQQQQRTVMVTGANGFLASYMVRDLLASGHVVHACVRDATREQTVQHLQSLPGASRRLKLFSTGHLEHAAHHRVFDGPMEGCDAVFHAATPLTVKFGNEHNGKHDIYDPAMTSTQELLDCLGRHAGTVRCLVLTSSMAAVAPHPEPAVKDESHWSDPDRQRARDNWYGCTKTLQEQLVREWVRTEKARLSHDFVYAAICPTMVIGPPLRKPDNNNSKDFVQVDGTMGSLQKWLRGGRTEAPNDSMSYIHVEDCAKMHTRILELQASDVNEHQRYMSLIESLHWNDILQLFREMHPGLPPYTPYQGKDKVTPTQFNRDNMESLLPGPIRTTREALQDSIQYLHQVGALD